MALYSAADRLLPLCCSAADHPLPDVIVLHRCLQRGADTAAKQTLKSYPNYNDIAAVRPETSEVSPVVELHDKATTAFSREGSCCA